MTLEPQLSVVIVTYKTRRLVEDCVRSAIEGCREAGVSYRVIVVDNDSRDGTVEMVRETFPEVVLIANTDNLGPAIAYNQGLRVALTSPYVMLLNSDIVVLPGTVQAMHSYLSLHPEVSGVCGDLLFPDGRRQRIRTAIATLVPPDFSRTFRVTFMGTGFQMTRREVWQDVGLLDENYYFYNEDLDWITRANRRGHRFMFLPEARVTHFLSQGSRQNYSRIVQELFKSNLYYFRKHYHPLIGALAYPALLLDIGLRRRRVRAAIAKEAAKPGGGDREALERLETSLQNLAISEDRMKEFARQEMPPAGEGRV